MLTPYHWTRVLAGVVVLAAAIPYVARIRHPDQKLLAAYLIFVSVFVTATVVLLALLGWLASHLGLSPLLEDTGPALIFLALAFLPALALATWQARKPPWRQRGPPD